MARTLAIVILHNEARVGLVDGPRWWKASRWRCRQIGPCLEGVQADAPAARSGRQRGAWVQLRVFVHVSACFSCTHAVHHGAAPRKSPTLPPKKIANEAAATANAKSFSMADTDMWQAVGSTPSRVRRSRDIYRGLRVAVKTIGTPRTPGKPELALREISTVIGFLHENAPAARQRQPARYAG
jgi:hypothetical protein